MASTRISIYAEFWPYYLGEHSRPGTRAWHFFGTTLTLLCFAAGVGTREPSLFAAMVVAGYAPAWIGHFTVEKNRPATFRYPLWSLLSDFRLYAVWLGGHLPRELDAAGVGR